MLPGTDGFIIIIIARWMDTIPDAVRVRTGSAYIYIALSSSLGESSRLTVLVVLYNDYNRHGPEVSGIGEPPSRG